jgi:hypothetical protein
MQIRASWGLATAIGILAGCAHNSQLSTHAISLADLPIIDGGKYKVDPYIEAARELQAAGKQKACLRMILLVRSHKGSLDVGNRERIGVLCRMLFIQRAGTDFEGPFLGDPVFLGSRRTGRAESINHILKKWPLEPIELVDDVPFAVVYGFFYEGIWDSSGTESYVRYCMTNCDWSSTRFNAKAKQQKEAAFRKLLSSPKWGGPLEGWAKEFLTKQIE